MGETRARIIVFIGAGHSGTVFSGASNVEIADALNAHQVRFTAVAAVKGRQESLERADFGSQCAIVKAITDPKRSSIDTKQNGAMELSEHYRPIAPAVLADARTTDPLACVGRYGGRNSALLTEGHGAGHPVPPMQHNGAGA